MIAPKFTKWNAVVKCIRVWKMLDSHNFIEGHNYMIKDGKMIDGNGKSSKSEYENVSELNDSFYALFAETSRNEDSR